MGGAAVAASLSGSLSTTTCMYTSRTSVYTTVSTGVLGPSTAAPHDFAPLPAPAACRLAMHRHARGWSSECTRAPVRAARPDPQSRPPPYILLPRACGRRGAPLRVAGVRAPLDVLLSHAADAATDDATVPRHGCARGWSGKCAM
ncbi:hypothetical protein GGX14DRAFT_563039 [Mycena pura]|uniref:Uncharacterized protein n=1 Tax=Mycena pura TaxID=153505 RepID=A0AAD6VKT3_9AGAR|nr:hypothetical protein GGX14DRAFT_563039 [Mycena pura]